MVQIFEIFSSLNWVNGLIEILSFSNSIIDLISLFGDNIEKFPRGDFKL